MLSKKTRRKAVGPVWSKKFDKDDDQRTGLFQPSVYHALVVIFLEFFSWGLLTIPAINVLNETFPDHTFLMNGLIQGVKGFLSFLSAPLIGALSDVWGRKPFLLLTVTFTCAPIPLMKFSPWWYFTILSISGVFAVTFSVVFAYVADVTTENDRSSAFALVSATFAASLVTSPTIGTYLVKMYSENLVIALATAIAVLDVLFILVAMPESLPETVRPSSWGSQISWEKADPFGVMDFSEEMVASFIAVIGVLSVIAQTALLAVLMRLFGSKHTIMMGLAFEILQLTIYGFGSQMWLLWIAGAIAALGSITYPAISSFVSTHAAADQQGVAQGVITGIRGLCNGLGPALYGFIFYVFRVDLSENAERRREKPVGLNFTEPITFLHSLHEKIMPGPPFAFGAFLVLLALLVAIFIPESRAPIVKTPVRRNMSSLPERQHSGSYEKEPLMFDVEELS